MPATDEDDGAMMTFEEFGEVVAESHREGTRVYRAVARAEGFVISSIDEYRHVPGQLHVMSSYITLRTEPVGEEPFTATFAVDYGELQDKSDEEASRIVQARCVAAILLCSQSRKENRLGAAA